MAQLSAEQVAQIAYQAGFRGADLVNMVAIGRRESGYRTDAWRTDNPGGGTGDVGLFQINHTNLSFLRQAIGITSIEQLLDPVTNARAAFALYQRNGLSPWSMGPDGWTAGGDPLYGTNVSAARVAVDNASKGGLLGADWSGGAGGMGVTPSSVGSAAAGPMKLPSDAQVFNVAGTYDIYAVFDMGQGVKIAYKIDTSQGAVDWKSKPLQTVSRSQWDQMAVIHAGDSAELAPVGVVFGSYRGFWDKTVAQVMGPFNPARNDPEVLRVLAEFAARPDMTEAELQNRLQATQWFQTRTQSELEWNGLSEAERRLRTQEAAQQAVETWFQYTGENISSTDPRIANYIPDLASGKLGWGKFSGIVKQQALENPESPWARQVRGEKEEQRQRGIDIENTAQKVRRTLERWGLKWTESEVMSWAKGIVSNQRSDDDLMKAVQSAAAVLYPWKDPTQETMQAAMPWLETYERVMEKAGTVFTAPIARALQSGTDAVTFEQELKRSDEWLTTKNARDELTSIVAAMGAKMGFQ